MAAAVTLYGTGGDTNTGTHTVTATPAVGDLPCIFVVNTGITAAPTVTDDNADGLGTYTQVLAVDWNDATPTASKLFLYVRNARIGSATSTIFSATGASSTGGRLIALKVTGMSLAGLAAVRQTASQANQASGGTPAPTFSASALTGNPTIGVKVQATNNISAPPVGWTERGDAGYNAPTTSMEGVSRDSGFTGTTITWAAAASGNFSDIIAELDAAAAMATPSTVVGSGAVPASSPSGQADVSPTQVVGSGAVPAVTIDVGAVSATATPTTVVGTGAVGSAAASGLAIAPPVASAGIGAVPTVAVTGNANVSPTTVAGTGGVSGEASLPTDAPAIVADGYALVPDVALELGTSVVPDTMPGVGDVPTVTISGGIVRFLRGWPVEDDPEDLLEAVWPL